MGTRRWLEPSTTQAEAERIFDQFLDDEPETPYLPAVAKKVVESPLSRKKGVLAACAVVMKRYPPAFRGEQAAAEESLRSVPGPGRRPRGVGGAGR